MRCKGSSFRLGILFGENHARQSIRTRQHYLRLRGASEIYRNQKPTPLKSVKALNILLIDSFVSRSTAAMVERVFDKIETVVDQVAEILEDESLPSRFVQLSELFSQNNQLLAELNVSHKELDNIRSVCSRYGLSSKLTGAGGGGYAIAVLLDDYQQGKDEYAKMFEELIGAGYKVKNTTVGDEGFKVEILNDK